jgi:beta-lactam-binding protein with PASTA domain
MEKYTETENVCPYCGYVVGTLPEQGNHMLPASRIHDRYYVGRVIGYGGFGVTYIGYDTELDRKVAIKEYMPNEFSGRVQGETKVTVYEGDRAEQFQSGLEKFVSEARRLAKFQDTPGIVQIYDSFTENNTAYIVMEYLEGETLKELLKREGKLPLDRALNILMPILSSLKVIHKSDMIHRDIAPDNIIVCKNGNVKLIDFGASRFATATHSRSLTVLIKQGYAPAEQYNSRGDQGPWTDVYALAAVFYKMLTGVTPEDSMERKAHDIMKPPSKEGAKVSKNIDTATMNALNISVKYRTQSMEDFEKELMSDSEVTRIIEPDRKDDVGKMPAWVKWTAIAAGAVAALFVILMATGVIKFGNKDAAVFVQEEGITYVPGFVNLLSDQAASLAEDNFVTIQLVDSIYSNEIPQDLICLQDPGSGTEVTYWGVVHLTVSAGVKLVDVPTLSGMNTEEAKIALESEGLTYEIQEIYSSYAEGYIISQSEDPLSRVEPGTSIIITVSKGPDPDKEIDTEVTVEVPELVGLKNEEAQRILNELNLFIEPKMEYSSTVPEGQIISQSLSSASEVHQGDTIVLVISLGEKMVNVPYVQVKSEEEARQLLEEKGLVVLVQYANSDTVLKGNVISQSIAANTSVKTGTTITLTVSSGPEVVMVAVPQLTGKSESDAQAALRELGLNGAPTYQNSDSVASGTVISQGTAPSTRVEAGAVISYVVSSGREPVRNWSDWTSSLPSGVNSASYDIETEYRYRDLETTSSESSSMAGWNLVNSDSRYTDYGAWSSWSDSAVTSSDSREVETQTLYQSRVKETTTSSDGNLAGWTQTGSTRSETVGEWSDWSRTAAVASEDANGRIEVETRTGTENVQTGTKYVYYRYYIANGKWWPEGGYTVYYTYSASFAGSAGQYQENVQYTDRGDYFNDGAGGWWGPTRTEGIYESREYTEYRTCAVTYNYTYSYEKWGGWSDWSTTPVTANASTEVNTQTQYRYRDRSLITTYYYERWGDWSVWQSGSGTSSASREVEVRYRYREK